MSLTVQCRLLCKTLKAVCYFSVFLSWILGFPGSKLESYSSVVTEGWCHAVPVGETVPNFKVLCRAVVNHTILFIFGCDPPPFSPFLNLHSLKLKYPRKQSAKTRSICKILTIALFCCFNLN